MPVVSVVLTGPRLAGCVPDVDDLNDVLRREHSIKDLESIPSNSFSMYATNVRHLGCERIPSDEFYCRKNCGHYIGGPCGAMLGQILANRGEVLGRARTV